MGDHPWLPSPVTFPTQTGPCLFAISLGGGVTAHALTVEGLAQVDSGLPRVAMGTLDFGITFFEFALVQDILTILIPMMTIRTREITAHVEFMGKSDGRTLFCSVRFPVVDLDVLRLSDQERHRYGRQ